MAIGRMISPELNQPRHPWYQKRNHVRIPKRAESKWWLDAEFTGEGGISGASGLVEAISDEYLTDEVSGQILTDATV